jgi:hypothetical protein
VIGPGGLRSGLRSLSGGAGRKVGDIAFFDTHPGAGWLLCDGSDYDPAVYPELTTKVPYVLGTGAKLHPGLTIYGQYSSSWTPTIVPVGCLGGKYVWLAYGATDAGGATGGLFAFSSTDRNGPYTRVLVTSTVNAPSNYPRPISGAVAFGKLWVTNGNQIFYSTDALTWTAVPATGNLNLSAGPLLFANNRLVVGSIGGMAAAYTADGLTWASVGNFPANIGNVGAISYGPLGWLFSGHQNSQNFMRCASSPPGFSAAPTDRVLPISLNRSFSFYAFNQYHVVAAPNGALVTSPDLANWTQRTPPPGFASALTLPNGTVAGVRSDTGAFIFGSAFLTWAESLIALGPQSNLLYDQPMAHANGVLMVGARQTNWSMNVVPGSDSQYVVPRIGTGSPPAANTNLAAYLKVA